MRYGWMLGALCAALWVTGCDDGSPTEAPGPADVGVDAGLLVDQGAGGEGGAAGEGGAGGQAGEGGAGGQAGEGGAGGEGGEGGAAGQPGALRLEPESAVLPVTNPPSQVQFTLYESGQPVPNDQVSWVAAPEELGTIEGGRFVSTGEVGVGTVLAEYRGVSTTARVEVVVSQDVVIGDVTPDEIAALDGADDAGAGCAPQWVYPEPRTVIPANLIGLELQWRGRSHDTFRVSIEVGGTVVRWFTDGESLIPDGDAWARVMGRAVGQTMQITLTGFGGQGGQACSTEPLPLEVDTSRVVGAVYYWSTADSGIMRLAAGETAPEPLLNPLTAPTINCPACHALSRDGTRIAFTRTTFPPFGDLATSLIDEPTTLLYDPAGVANYFPSFAPDNVRMVAGGGGQLVIRNSDTGAEIDRLPNLPETVAGQPDWSWQTDKIVGVVGPGGLANPLPDAGVTGGSLYLWESLDGAWMEPRPLALRPNDQRWLDRPAFSPEGTFVAFNSVGEGGGQGMGNANVDLQIIRLDGGDPVTLTAANGGDFNGNSWPKWSPTDRRGRLWLAFSSLRAYGDKLGAGERPQIWVTAIDPHAEPGTDPSAPAFWLPYQSLRSGNHIPYWAAYTKE